MVVGGGAGAAAGAAAHNIENDGGFGGFVAANNDNGNNDNSTVVVHRVIDVVDSIGDVTDAAALERFRTYVVCNSCKDSMIRGVVPNTCVAYDYRYAPRPVGLPELNAVEERLIAPRLPFMSIRRLTRATGQYGICGQVVNVPIEVPALVLSLPRRVPEDAAIDVNIKRRLMSPATYKRGLVKRGNILA